MAAPAPSFKKQSEKMDGNLGVSDGTDTDVNLEHIFSLSPPTVKAISLESDWNFKPTPNLVKCIFLPWKSGSALAFIQHTKTVAPGVFNVEVLRESQRVSGMTVKFTSTENSRWPSSVREARILSQLDSKYVIRLLAGFHYISPKSKQSLLFLEQGLHDASTFPFNALAYRRFQRHTLNAINYVHGQGILHRDIKPKNIIACKNTSTGRVRFKLADFNSARELPQPGETISAAGTEGYRAPELRSGSGATKKSDIWAFGATIVAVMLNQYPPPEESLTPSFNNDPFSRLISQQDRNTFRKNVRALSNNPESRPLAASLLG
jgi:serine/threonine protein kinase